MTASNTSRPFDTITLGALAENGNGVDVTESGSDVVDGGPTGTRLVGSINVALEICVALRTVKVWRTADALRPADALNTWVTTWVRTWVTTTATGTVSVTTEDPFCPHPAQLCVSVVRGTTGAAVAVAHTVYVMQDVTTTRCAGSVLQTEVYVTVEVTVCTLAAAEPLRPTATEGLVSPSAGAGDGV